MLNHTEQYPRNILLTGLLVLAFILMVSSPILTDQEIKKAFTDWGSEQFLRLISLKERFIGRLWSPDVGDIEVESQSLELKQH